MLCALGVGSTMDVTDLLRDLATPFDQKSSSQKCKFDESFADSLMVIHGYVEASSSIWLIEL